jgi:hypothetical protein
MNKTAGQKNGFFGLQNHCKVRLNGRKYKIFPILFLAALTSVAKAQTDIENEIKSFVDSAELLINNGRRMILQHVQEKDFEKVAEIHGFLNRRTLARDCAAFTYRENLYIAGLTGNWHEFLAIAEHFSEIQGKSLCYPSYGYYSDYTFFNTLRVEFEKNAPQLFEEALSANLTPEDEELLELYFHVLENKVDEAYGKKLKSFKKKYPQSKYDDFVNGLLPRGFFVGGISLGMGATRIFPTGNLSSHFAPATVFNFAFDIYFDRFFVGLQLDIGKLRLKVPLPSQTTGYDHDFQVNDRLSYMHGGLLGGYTVIRNYRLQLSPFINFGGTSLESNFYKDEAKKHMEFYIFDETWFVGAGLRADINLFDFETNSGFFTISPTTHRIHLRLDAGYNIPIKYEYTPARGNVSYVKMSLIWQSGFF